mgnify:CR=1 FL=1
MQPRQLALLTCMYASARLPRSPWRHMPLLALEQNEMDEDVCEECEEAALAPAFRLYDSHTHAIGETQALADAPTTGGLCLMSKSEEEWALLPQAAALLSPPGQPTPAHSREPC